jgi:glycosyltransferase involved in cell wall biosynthesis
MTQPAELAVISTHVPRAQGYGGVASSIGNLLGAWARSGRRVALCSSDASTGRPLTSVDVADACHVASARLYRTWYFDRWGFGPGAPMAVWATLAMAPVAYLNGIATWPTTIGALLCRALGRPYTVALRGGLMAEHVDIIRRRKKLKWLYYRLITLPSLRRAWAIHCTSALERDAAAAVLAGGAIPRLAVIANGVTLPHAAAPPRRGPLVVCYAGRISREKGINRLLKIWRGWRRDDERLIVAGSGTGAYASAFEQLAAADPTVSFRGYVSGAEMRTIMADSDFIVLPSGIEDNDLRENFGNAVAEALALGRPALVTRGLAWDDLEPAGAGFLFGPDDGEIAAALTRARSADRAASAASARAYAARHLDVAVTATSLWRLCMGEDGGATA